MTANANGPWQFVPARDQKNLAAGGSAPTIPQPQHGREVRATSGAAQDAPQNGGAAL